MGDPITVESQSTNTAAGGIPADSADGISCLALQEAGESATVETYGSLALSSAPGESVSTPSTSAAIELKVQLSPVIPDQVWHIGATHRVAGSSNWHYCRDRVNNHMFHSVVELEMEYLNLHWQLKRQFKDIQIKAFKMAATVSQAETIVEALEGSDRVAFLQLGDLISRASHELDPLVEELTLKSSVPRGPVSFPTLRFWNGLHGSGKV